MRENLTHHALRITHVHIDKSGNQGNQMAERPLPRDGLPSTVCRVVVKQDIRRDEPDHSLLRANRGVG